MTKTRFDQKIMRIALLMSVILLLESQVSAFDSFPGGNIHRDITRSGLAGLGLSEDAVQRVVDKNYDQDWNEVSVTLGGLKPNENYRPEHHCDRNALVTNSNAFKAGARYIKDQRGIAVARMQAGDPKAALDAIGRALHARQDFFSHSNFVDLLPADQAIAQQALNDPNKTPPTALKITGYDRETGKDIPGDDYGHDAFCKDNPNKNAEAKKKVSDQFTKFDYAKEFAVQDTKAFAESIKAEVGDATWARLRMF